MNLFKSPSPSTMDFPDVFNSPKTPVEVKTYSFRVKVVSAKLPFKFISLFAKVSIGDAGKPKMTKAIKDGNEPTWNEEFTL
jgi:hypothetical protein